MPIQPKEDDKFKDLFFEEEDLPYEEELLRNPYSVKGWLRYVDHKRKSGAPNSAVNLVFERAVKELPGSYKLWFQYLRLRQKQVRFLCISDPAYEAVNNAFERAVVFMNKMPRIWIEYVNFLARQCLITRTRKTFDRALSSLPVTQHNRIWPHYLKFIKSHKDIDETIIRAYRRYVKLCPDNMEEFIDYLRTIDHLDEASIRLAGIINDETFVSREGKSKHQLWNELCEMISKNPTKIKHIKVEPIIRQGIKRYTDQIGLLWNALADYYIRGGHFEKARDIYEEAIQTVMTVRDFTQVFDSFAQFEESVISARIETAKSAPTEEDDVDLELRLARLDDLMDRRPLLLNSVLLRQNPHNVHEWHKRVELYGGKPKEVVDTYTEAVQTVDPKLATGHPHTLWVEFAKFYEKAKQIKDARLIFERAKNVAFKYVNDLASIWCEWAEMELRNNNFDDALALMRRATTIPPQKVDYNDPREAVQRRLYKNIKVWAMFADLEESFGTFKTCKAVYDQIIDLRIATPQIIINYGMFLEESKYFEEAFRAYEKGVALFKWPNVYEVWNTYLTKFIKRYGGKKLERARDLFEQCLEHVPAKFAKPLYLLYAKLELDYGLARHGMAVYERAAKAVLPEERYEIYNIYIRTAADLYGVTHTRQIYENAIEELPDDKAKAMCLRFADLERKLGEIDRARAVYAYCSQLCDPRVSPEFWQVWKEFEIKHGNEDTVREMLRIKRSVQATFNTEINFMSAQMLAVAKQANIGDEAAAGDSMQQLEAGAEVVSGDEVPAGGAGRITFVSSGTVEEKKTEVVKYSNPDEIALEEDDEEEGEETEEEKGAKEKQQQDDDDDVVMIEQRVIPDEVYGALAPKHDSDDEDMG